MLLENRNDAYLDVYARPALYDKKRPAMLVLPGGGYGTVCSDREGEPVAMLYLAQGFNCFVLHYPCAPDILSENGIPLPLIVASKAVAHIRRNAERYSVDPDKTAAIGFSAGGHLAASLACMWHYDFVTKEAGIEYGENRIAAAVLSYAVISAAPEFSHGGSFKNLLTGGKDAPNSETAKFWSIENQVSDKTCPIFIWHTAADATVPVGNAITMAEALSEKKVPFEMHIFPDGAHGLSTCKTDVFGGERGTVALHAEVWSEASVKWLKSVLGY